MELPSAAQAHLEEVSAALPEPDAPSGPAAQPVISPTEPQQHLPELGVILIDNMEACRAFCERWRRQTCWAFALDYTAADTRASKQIAMPRVGSASNAGESARFDCAQVSRLTPAGFQA